jgi:hypothetical protein
MPKLNVQVLPPLTTLFSTKDYRTYTIIIERQNKRETLYQILTYTRYIYMCVWIQKLIVNFISLSLKKKESNDFTFALSCFLNIRLFLSLISILYESRWYFADSAIYMCAHLVTYIYIYVSRMIKQKLPLDLLTVDFV